MPEGISIGESELEIMKVLWKAGEAVNSQYISSAVADKGWKRTTIATFLTRLCEKGAISAEKRGNLYYYTAVLTKKEYRRGRTKSLITDLFDGSARELAASLFEEGLTEEDIRELRELRERGEEG